MKIRMTGEKKVAEVKDSYARRLIEQGKATPVKSGAKKPPEA